MKKIILSALGIFGAAIMVAQPTIVSTSPMNRAPVLEEFTGVNCQYCPDGHKLAQNLKELNSSAVLVNIHAGFYANTTPNYTTAVGEAIDDEAAVSGYPSGSVNRSNSIAGAPTTGNFAMSRQYWSNAFAVVAGETSPVNIAIEPTYNEGSKELSVLVEVYYTDSTDTSDFVHVMLLQSNIKGPQVAAETYYPEMMYDDGDYNHNHMLRASLSGTWGIEVPTTGEGYFWDTTLTMTMPNNYGPVATDWKNMEVAAYISDTRRELYTGTSEWLVPITNPWDFSSTTSNNAGADYCQEAVDVSIDITNEGSQTLTSFDINYTVSGGPMQTETYTGSLAPNASATIDFSLALQNGLNDVAFFPYTNVMNDNNEEVFNPTSSGFFAIPDGFRAVKVSDDAIDYPLVIDAEDAGFQEFPEFTYGVNNGLGYQGGISSANVNGLNHDLGAYEESDNTLWYGFYYSGAGTSGYFVTDPVDLTETERPKLTFSHAFAEGEDDALTIEASADCGVTWTTVFFEEGEDLATANETSDPFWPEEDDWTTTKIALDSFSGEEVIFRLTGTCDGGNSLFVDDIGVTAWPLGVEEDATASISFFPNPTNGNVRITGLEERATVKVIDLSGRTVLNKVVKGSSLDVSALNSGVYTIVIESADITKTDKLTIVK